MRHTVRGLIIQNRKILLVTGYGADFYWTPGGGVEVGELQEETLRREIAEEIGVEILSITPHSKYIYEDQKVENFLIEIEGNILPGNEITKTAWYYTKSNIKPSKGFKDMVLPMLLDDNLID